MIAPGRYKARAVEADLGIAGTGAEQVAVLFEILDGDHAGEEITWFGHFSEKTEARTLESLRHCGWNDDDLAKLSGVTDNEVQLVIEHENDQQGNPRARVKWVNRAGAAGLALKTRMDEAQKKAFAARMRGSAIASRGANGKPAQAASKAKAPARKQADLPPEAFGPDDDDIPF